MGTIDSPSISTSLTKTINGSHELTIKGYSLAKGMGIGKYISSDTFTVGGYTWAICFFPDGKALEDDRVYVSLFISLACDAVDVRALFEVTLVDQSGNGEDKVHSHFGRAPETGPYTLKVKGSMWGYKRFYRRTALETSDYLKDDCLLIRCTVGVVKSNTEAPEIYRIKLPPSDIGQHYGNLLESGECADVKFEVGGEIFSAHKLVLAARSPIFRAQLFGPMKDDDIDCIKVMEIEAPVFKALLHYMYWDSYPDTQELACINPEWATSSMAQHLLAAADRYGLDRLRLLCESKLCADLAVDNVAFTMSLAEQHHCSQLKSQCLKFIALPKNLKAVMQTDGYEYLKESCPTLVMELLKYVSRYGPLPANAVSLDGIIVKSENAVDDDRRVKQRIG